LTVIADNLGFSRNRVVAETLEKGLEIESHIKECESLSSLLG